MSPDGLGLIDAGVAKPVCTDCGLGLMDLDDDPEVVSRVGGKEIPIPAEVARLAMEIIRKD